LVVFATNTGLPGPPGNVEGGGLVVLATKTGLPGPPGNVEGGGLVVFATNTGLPGPPGNVDGGGFVVLASSTDPEPEVTAFRPIAPVNTNRTKTTKINHLFMDSLRVGKELRGGVYKWLIAVKRNILRACVQRVHTPTPS
jgi:hypothetical protein